MCLSIFCCEIHTVDEVMIAPSQGTIITLERFSFAFTANGKRQVAACRKSKKIVLFYLISLVLVLAP